MGQKVNPIAFRVGVTKSWDSSWFSGFADYKDSLLVDLKIRKYFDKLKREFLISNVQIKKFFNKLIVTVETAKPGIFIKSAGGGIANITADLKKLITADIRINVKEVKSFYHSADIIASHIATQIKNRASHVKVIKKAIDDARKHGVLGIKIQISGRISGAEIARMEVFSEGSMPLSTIRNNIDYALAEPVTVYGVIGIKVWVFTKNTKAVN